MDVPNPNDVIRRMPFISHLAQAAQPYIPGGATGMCGDLTYCEPVAARPAFYYFTLADSLLDSDKRQYQSKYNTVEDTQSGANGGWSDVVGGNVLAVTLQQPGAHKYDTMIGLYKLDDTASGGGLYWGTLINDPMTVPTRQESTARENWRDVATAAAVIGAVYGAGTLISAATAGAAGAAGVVSMPSASAASSAVMGGGAGAGAGGAAGVVGAIQAGTRLVGTGLALANSYNQIREVRDGSPTPTAQGGSQRVDDSGYIITQNPDGSTRGDLPPVGVAYALPDGRALVNNGDGTFAIVDQLGNVIIRRYPASITGNITQPGNAPAGGGGLSTVTDTLKRLTAGEWLAAATLFAMLAR